MVTNYGSFIASDDFNEFAFIRPRVPLTLFFQRGIDQHGMFNGVTMEDVLEALLARLKYFNQGDYVCEENTEAIHAMEVALKALMRRQARREEETNGEVTALDNIVERSDLEEIMPGFAMLFRVRREAVDRELGQEDTPMSTESLQRSTIVPFDSPAEERHVGVRQDQVKCAIKPTNGLTYPRGFNQRLVNQTLNKVRGLLNKQSIRPELVLEFNGTSANRSFSIPNATSLTIHRSDTNETKRLTITSNVIIPAEDIPQMGTLTIKDVVIRDGSTRHGTLNLSSQDNLVAVHSYGDLPFTGLRHEDCTNLTNVPSGIPSTVTDLSSCFNNCPSFNDPNVSQWDVSNVTNMYGMFSSTSSFNQDISNWNTGNVTSMNSMFSRATNFNQDINNWDTSSVTDMSYMFGYSSSFNQDLRYWCVTNILEEPINFNQYGILKPSYHPVWGACPRGEDQN